MFRYTPAIGLFVFVSVFLAHPPYAMATTSFAHKIVSYDPGTTPVTGFTLPGSAIGAPENFTGDTTSFPGVVSPFNPPFLIAEVVSIGEAGHLTLQLAHYAIPQPGIPEIGIFTNAGFADQDFPNGLTATTLVPNDGFVSTFGMDIAHVEVSEDGITFVSLGTILFDIPTNGFTDPAGPFASSPGGSLADPSKPFTGSLNDFDDLPYNDADPLVADILDLLDGSAGGKWLDISGTGLSKVGFIRFSVLDDADITTGLNFELDAVSVAASAIGATVPEPNALALFATGAGVLFITRRRSANKHTRPSTRTCASSRTQAAA